MFRLKDFLTMISMQNDGLNVCIYDKDGIEINYGHADVYINLLVDNIRFVKESNIGKLVYRCDIVVSNMMGETTMMRNFIKYDEIVECCKDDKVIMIPVDSPYNTNVWDGTKPLKDHYDSEAVINIIPIFCKDCVIWKVILADNAQIVHMPVAE